MYRAAAGHLGVLKRHGATRFASTSVAKPSSSGGLFSSLFGGNSSRLPSLEFPLEGVTVPEPMPDYVEVGQINLTRLRNGVRIASETSPRPVVSMGLFINSGSIYETPYSSGVSHLLEKMSFKTTTNRSHLRLVREMEAIGAKVAAAASRDQMVYTCEGLKTYLPEMVEVLVDSVRNPAFLDWEVKEQVLKIKEEMAEASKNPEALLLEALHSAGYKGALAQPLLASEAAIKRLNETILEEFVQANYTAPRMVLAASGVGHNEFVSIAEELLSDLPKVDLQEEPTSVYTGGEYRCQTDSDKKAHVALAFELSGGWHDEKTALAAIVLQALLGGGGSFSAGGPGKGLHSRLYLRILNQFPEIETFSAFQTLYNRSGLFGIYTTCQPDFVPKAVDLVARELTAVATPGMVTKQELNRAKEATKSSVLMNLESGIIKAEDIGRQLLTYGTERKPVGYFLDAIDELTLNDITSVADKMISSPLTMASRGNVLRVPSYETISRKFSSGGARPSKK